ncbi:MULTISPECIES: ankyrin repeat domain-containing protein [Trichocoleus]|uniref:Ankyrin repeat domain-containing protein n=1 Tax=Trichocoleus desertorum GB2-A4 TaxID=2933944 RepID=A0ABV0JG05_9CYAN|nr:ankyrin repeat domain-containing protein [Trichocoleus sp. FACHB-46]MBD1864801.1 ankyrin repeat domain-containing protein [Trichocoleus sp. FACHB-46]
MQIHLQVKQGNIAGVAAQIASGVDVDALDEYSAQTPLMVAVTSLNAGLDMMQFLIDQGADINAVDEETQKTVLGFAVQTGNLDKVRSLLEAGADIHYQTSGGYDVLINAVHGRDIARDPHLIPLLNLLIERGAKVDGVSRYGESALRVISIVGRFDAVQVLLAAGADAEQLAWTDLMYAIVFEPLATVHELLEQGADLTARDCWLRTPWLLCLQMGDVEKAKLLLAAGANPHDVGISGKTALMFAIESDCTKIVQWLVEQGWKIEVPDEFGDMPLMVAASRGATDCVQILIEHGADPKRANHCNDTAIKVAANLPIVRILVNAGEDMSEINDDMRKILTEVGGEDLQLSLEQYVAGRHRRFGQTNPEVMDIEFWKAMIRCGHPAYYAQAQFPDTGDLEEPVWCYYRYGRTITELPDGRIVEIGGEHEDYYDPDFCIYNDVVVYAGDGTFKILGYPQAVFPPTDFHRATLAGDYIYIIGNLGYAESRIEQETPVYRLHCQTFQIEQVETIGDRPGWISRHQAAYKEPSQIWITGGQIYVRRNGQSEYIENQADYILDLTDFRWTRRTD